LTQKIVVTGSTGFLGRHTMPVLVSQYGKENVIGLSHKNYDLTDPIQVKRMFEELKPDILIHLAAYVGGIGANSKLPADFFYINNLLTSLAFDYAAKNKTAKLIYPIGGCCYPSTSPSPISESEMWNGYPQKESAGYAMAKKVGVVASLAYREQYGLNSVITVPGNMFGEYDNFSLADSHVIPATIRRFYEAKENKLPKITMWGSGKPQRDFVYVGDVATTFPFFIEKYDSNEPVNISSGTSTSIRELAETVKELIGYEGEIHWDATKPDGQMVKIFDTARMKELGLSCPTSLCDGLKKTIDWFVKNYYTGNVRL
jgi:GDP-L-fucose synthase